MKALAIGDDKNAILIIQQSQTDPQKALAELVENSIDSGATRIRIVRGRLEGSTSIRVEDNGEGVRPGPDGGPDFDRVARSICDSYKRRLNPEQRSRIQGEFAIGMLGFAAIGARLELISRCGRSETRGFRLAAGSVEYETFAPEESLSDCGTVVTVSGVHKEIRNRLAPEKLARYLGAELRDRLRASGARVTVVDRVAGGKEIVVRPTEFEGERLTGIGPIEHSAGRVKFELYACKEGSGGRVGVARRGTRLVDDLCSLEELNHEPWNLGALEGLIQFDGLTPSPASRKGIVPDENLRVLLDAVASVEGTVRARLRAIEEEREEHLGREIVRQLQETFASVLEQLPDYDWFGTERGGPLPGQPQGGHAKRKEVRISAGPLSSVEISPRLAQLAPGESKKFTARALDPTGAVIPLGITYRWHLRDGLASVTSEGAVATLLAGGHEGEGVLSVTAQAGRQEATAQARFLILDVKKKAQGRKLPFLEAVHRSNEDWRSRWMPSRNVIEYNSGHADYLDAKERGTKGVARYLALLVAKELILHNFSGVQQVALLERMVEVVHALQRRL